MGEKREETDKVRLLISISRGEVLFSCLLMLMLMFYKYICGVNVWRLFLCRGR